ncbi:sensor histidine kinase [Nocardioides speluncae]|uniref:sensor histidine kinase n=1 Tax=Nocardioides speluncae TaxID=2670337 RepID=UPI0014758819|nr:histidine kinase [Nocardioides speluncae]
MTSRSPFPWVSPLLYGAVLVAGTYAGLSGLGDTQWGLFLVGIAALFGTDLLEARGVSPVVLLVVRSALFVAVAVADGSGLSRALFVLGPWTAYFAFGRRVSIAVAGAWIGVAVAGWQWTAPQWYADRDRVADLLMLALAMVAAVGMAAVASAERAGRQHLEASRRDVARLSAAAERNRIARDIHDDLGHHLTAIVVLLEKASVFGDRDPDAAATALADAERSARKALADVRRSVGDLREDRPFVLAAALRELVNGRVPVEVSGDEAGYPEPVLVTLYHAAQEGITNARRHANATEIGVRVELRGSQARLVVSDNGCGTPPGRGGFGLRGLRERAQQVGGVVDLESSPGVGTRLIVTVPAAAS